MLKGDSDIITIHTGKILVVVQPSLIKMNYKSTEEWQNKYSK